MSGDVTANQEKLVLAHLKARGRITPGTAVALYSIYRLSGVIWRLIHLRGYQDNIGKADREKGERHATYTWTETDDGTE